MKKSKHLCHGSRIRIINFQNIFATSDFDHASLHIFHQLLSIHASHHFLVDLGLFFSDFLGRYGFSLLSFDFSPVLHFVDFHWFRRVRTVCASAIACLYLFLQFFIVGIRAVKPDLRFFRVLNFPDNILNSIQLFLDNMWIKLF